MTHYPKPVSENYLYSDYRNPDTNHRSNKGYVVIVYAVSDTEFILFRGWGAVSRQVGFPAAFRNWTPFYTMGNALIAAQRVVAERIDRNHYVRVPPARIGWVSQIQRYEEEGDRYDYPSLTGDERNTRPTTPVQLRPNPVLEEDPAPVEESTENQRLNDFALLNEGVTNPDTYFQRFYKGLFGVLNPTESSWLVQERRNRIRHDDLLESLRRAPSALLEKSYHIVTKEGQCLVLNLLNPDTTYLTGLSAATDTALERMMWLLENAADFPAPFELAECAFTPVRKMWMIEEAVAGKWDGITVCSASDRQGTSYIQNHVLLRHKTFLRLDYAARDETTGQYDLRCSRYTRRNNGMNWIEILPLYLESTAVITTGLTATTVELEYHGWDPTAGIFFDPKIRKIGPFDETAARSSSDLVLTDGSVIHY